ncbi:ABC transporter substrate-binding protein [Paenibacillus alba]|uniref:Sugar ABC transporter substrate-binding protein n=1 Tax=Paenibacillus alba TaxID=1197127 RepID=A0ABU6G3F8_9BACL|nr:sugar ABC transporter substrate-binding protein [Paenibacillus alba]MEC0228697.1 sugar ABC transporter substrate-binding protein [Paenibacillus alba]NQX67548.1 sugar ABC transporter substrate-binding protein [Paenibacillus alba]
MKRKSWSLLLASCLSISLVGTACSNSSSTANTAGGAASPASSDKKVKLVVWIWESAKVGLDANMEAFQKENPNIEVEYQIMKSTDLYQKYLISSNTQDAVPDIVGLESTNMAQMVQIDSLLDITKRVEPYKDKMNAYKWEDATKDNKVYAMPWDSGPVVMFYRNDIFAKAGLPTDPKEVAQKIQSWDDYYQAAKQIKEKTGVLMFGDSKTNSSNRVFESMMWQRGVWYFDKEGNVSVEKPEVKEITDYLVKMQKEGLVYDARANTDPWGNAIKEGKVATVVGGSWHDAIIEGQYAPDDKGKWSVTTMPKWSKDDKYTGANQGGSNLAINKNSKHPEEAWKFIEFMLGKDTSQITMMKKAGLFPSLTTTYSDAAFNEPSAYFNNQPIRQVYAESLKQTYPLAYTSDFPMANKRMTDVWAQIFLNNVSTDQALKAMADELRQKTKRK